MKPLYTALILLWTITGCKKSVDVPPNNPPENEPADTIKLPKPNLCFDAQAAAPQFFAALNQAHPVAFIDSSFSFTNCTKSSDSLTFVWDFGDGTRSSVDSPMHKYSKRGAYFVKLIAFRKEIAIDSITKQVRVILGQKDFSLSAQNDYPIDFTSTTDGGILVLGQSDYNSGYYLMKTDSLLNFEWKKTLSTSSRNFRSIKKVSDGNYILSGNNSAIDGQFSLTKMDPQGTVLWTRTYNNTNGINSYAEETQDNGFITIGEEQKNDMYGNPAPRVMLIKTDQNGQFEWEKRFPDGMKSSGGLIVLPESDGVVFAANRLGQNCFTCDSVYITKLSSGNGSVIWQNTVAWGFNYYSGNVKLTKAPNGYLVINMTGPVIFSFDKNGKFTDRNVLDGFYRIHAVHATSDGGMLASAEESGNGFRASFVKTDGQGNRTWQTGLNGNQYYAGGSSCCSNSRPVSSFRLTSGGHIILANRFDHDENWSNYYSKIVLLQIDDDGAWQ